MDPLLGMNHTLDPQSGEFVDSKQVHMAEVLQDVYPMLRLVWIPKKDRSVEDVNPYAIVDQTGTCVMWISEAEMARPDLVLARLFYSDQSKHPKGAVLSRLETIENAQEMLQKKQYLEEQEERKELVRSIFSSKKNKYTANYKGRKLTFRS